MPSGGNHLLAALAPEEMKRLREHMELVPLARRATLYEAGSRFQYAYFPTSGIVSLMHVMPEGSAVEVGVIGNEGFTGACALLSGATPVRLSPSWRRPQRATAATRSTSSCAAGCSSRSIGCRRTKW
jgi:CRP-like cAMP-binding protein